MLQLADQIHVIVETRSGVEAVGARTTFPALEPEEIETVEMTAAPFPATPDDVDRCSFSLEPRGDGRFITIILDDSVGDGAGSEDRGDRGKIYAPNMPR